MVKKETEKKLEDLHEALAEALLAFVRGHKEFIKDAPGEGEEKKYPSAMFNVARQFLKDNGVEKIPKAVDDPLGLLGEELPDFDNEGVDLLPN